MLKTKTFTTMWNWIAAMLIIPVAAHIGRIRESLLGSNLASRITNIHFLALSDQRNIVELYNRCSQRISSFAYTLIEISRRNQWWGEQHRIPVVAGPLSCTGTHHNPHNVPSGLFQQHNHQHHTLPSFKSP